MDYVELTKSRLLVRLAIWRLGEWDSIGKAFGGGEVVWS